MVVCTHRHGDDLLAALESLASQVPPEAEVILVRSQTVEGTDLPPDLARWISESSMPLGVIAEPLAGSALARSRGLASAASDMVLFLDDDCEALPGWYKALREAMNRPSVAAAGGTILPRWPGGSPPAWLHPRLFTYFGERHAGPEAGHRPFAANMAISRAATARVGGLRTDLGHVGTKPGLHEETELCERLFNAGYEVAEAPGAVVLHRVRSEQLRLCWVLRRAWHEGRDDARRDLPGLPAAGVHSVKLACLVAVFPLSLLKPCLSTYLAARILANLSYLRTSLKLRSPAC